MAARKMADVTESRGSRNSSGLNRNSGFGLFRGEQRAFLRIIYEDSVKYASPIVPRSPFNIIICARRAKTSLYFDDARSQELVGERSAQPESRVAPVARTLV